MRTALFWNITQRVVVIFTDVSGQPIFSVPFVNPEDGLYRNVGKKLSLLAAS